MHLIDIARQCRAIVLRATAALGPDLNGFSIVDLCADALPLNISLQDIKCALVIAGLDRHVSSRLRQQYSK